MNIPRMRVPGASVTSTSALPGSSDIGVIRVTSGIADLSMKMNAAGPKRRRDIAGYLAAIGAFVLCLTQAPSAHADSVSCLAKVSAYVAELDELLSKERNWITPYEDLNKRYFPVRDCEADALLEVVRSSRFIRSISYNSRTKEYFIYFSSDEVLVGFGYRVSEKKSTFDSPMWVHK
jgi:hypothetical protein